jgi:hypothetical protein
VDIHAGLVKNKVLNINDLSFIPKARGSIREMCARNPSLTYVAFEKTFVQASNCILRPHYRNNQVL